MEEGIIFSIEEFAIHDGPGIRTTVFLKGCPLRCVWCHNPEGFSFKPQYLSTKNGKKLCGEKITTNILVERILKNKEFLEMNGGGVTLTGGEPLAQPAFVTEFLREIYPIHRVIETSGYAPSEVFNEVISLVDLVLFDIKHTNPLMHKKFTRVHNKLILGNLNSLIESGRDFIVRLPLIPGVNDSQEDMMAVYSLIKDAKSLVRVELLPYHKTAGAKYEMAGMLYNPPFDQDREVNICNVFEKFNIKTIIQ